MSMFEALFGSPEARRKERMQKECRVYFIREGIDGPVKIGSSVNPKGRIATLQTANPTPLFLLGHIPGDERLEKILHNRFRPFRKSHEWFHPVPEVLDYIEKALNDPKAVRNT